ncbi:MAG: four helix bundle protein [Phycisphaerae bacterium]|nr:four helix bundle protein [Phycisphaerae bacterium]
MQDFRELKVWHRSHSLVLDVYRTTAEFPREELYGLTSQMRRAAVSVPANIAEGCGRRGGLDLARHLQIAAGSASELEYLFVLTHDLNLLNPDQKQHLMNEITEVKRMLTSLIQKVRNPR